MRTILLFQSALVIFCIGAHAQYPTMMMMMMSSESPSESSDESGIGSGSGFDLPRCPAGTLVRSALLDSDMVTVFLVDLDQDLEEYFLEFQSLINVDISISIAVSYVNITINDSLSLNLLAADFEDGNSLEANISVTSDFVELNCSFSVVVEFFSVSLCVNEMADVVRILLLSQSINIVVSIEPTSVTTAVLRDIRDTMASLANLNCPDNCASCGLNSDCAAFFELCDTVFTRSDVIVFSVSAASSSAARSVRQTDNSIITLSIAFGDNFPVSSSSSSGIPADTLSDLVTSNIADFEAATGLDVVSVEVNESPTSVDSISEALAPIILPILVVLSAIAMVTGIAVVVGVSCYRKHKKNKKNKVKPGD